MPHWIVSSDRSNRKIALDSGPAVGLQSRTNDTDGHRGQGNGPSFSGNFPASLPDLARHLR